MHCYRWKQSCSSFTPLNVNYEAIGFRFINDTSRISIIGLFCLAILRFSALFIMPYKLVCYLSKRLVLTAVNLSFLGLAFLKMGIFIIFASFMFFEEILVCLRLILFLYLKEEDSFCLFTLLKYLLQYLCHLWLCRFEFLNTNFLV